MLASLATRSVSLKALAISVGVSVLLLAALAGAGWLLHAEITAHGETKGLLTAEKASAKRAAEQANLVNTENLATIKALRSANAQFARDAEQRMANQARAIADLQRRSSGLQRMLDAERRARDDIYRRDPDAQAWAEALVPPAIADRLRRRANG